MRVDRDGRVTPILEEPAAYEHPRFSSDGRRIALSVQSPEGGTVWVYSLERRTLQRVTFDAASRKPSWSPDGTSLAFSSTSDRANVFVASPGAGNERRQITTSDFITTPTAWSPDGRFMVFRQLQGGGDWDIGVVPADGGELRFLVDSPFNETHGAPSPDGAWLAYVSDESGRQEVYVTPFGSEGSVVPVSTEGGTEPVWSKDGTELFYRNGDRLLSVTVSTDTNGLVFGPPRELFTGGFLYDRANLSSNYDVSPDGNAFVLVEGELQAQLVVVLHWFQELERLVPKR